MQVSREGEEALVGETQGELRQSLQALDSEQQEQFFRWLTGGTDEPPAVVKSVVSNLAHKMNVTMGYLTAMNLSRMNRIADFMRLCEESLFARCFRGIG